MLGLSSGCCCPSAGSEPCDTVDAGWAKDDRFSETCSTAIDSPGVEQESQNLESFRLVVLQN